jgi:hypothetical protein
MFTNNLIKAFADHGFVLEPVKDNTIIDKYPKGHRDVLKNVTTHHPRRFPQAFEGLNLLLVSKGHFVAIANGQVECYSVNNSLRAIFIYSVRKLES